MPASLASCSFGEGPPGILVISSSIQSGSDVGRVNTVTKYSLIRAKATGLRMIAFGVETGTDEGLKILRKATTRSEEHTSELQSQR